MTYIMTSSNILSSFNLQKTRDGKRSVQTVRKKYIGRNCGFFFLCMQLLYLHTCIYSDIRYFSCNPWYILKILFLSEITIYVCVGVFCIAIDRNEAWYLEINYTIVINWALLFTIRSERNFDTHKLTSRIYIYECKHVWSR